MGEAIDARRRRVADLSAQDMTADQIGEILGCTARTVQRDRHELGITRTPPTPLTDEQWAIAARLIEDGCSHAEIARTLGCSDTPISRRFPGTQWTRKQTAEYLRVLRESRRREVAA